MHAKTQFSRIDVPEKHSKYKEILIRFRFFIFEKVIVKEKFFYVSVVTD